MERRIFGLENEYALNCSVGDTKPGFSESSAAVTQFFTQLTTEYGSSSAFLENGSRLYLDCSHPEYATPECDSVLDVVAAQRAGERVLRRLLGILNANLAAGQKKPMWLFRNNTDGKSGVYGAHENYLISRQVSEYRLNTSRMPFLVTRQLLCGAGDVRKQRDGGPVRFLMSQRAEHVYEPIAGGTTTNRPIINTRDEPHASGEWRRIHDIVGDANMSEVSEFLKIGSQHLVLRMIEDGEDFGRLSLQDPVSAIRATGADLTGRASLMLARSTHDLRGRWTRRLTAADIQEVYLRRAEQLYGAEEGETAQILALWRKVVDAYRTPGRDGQPPDVDTIADRLGRTVDWAIKYRLVRQQMAKLECDLTDPRIATVNLLYHNIDPEIGLFQKLQARGLVDGLLTEAQIERFVDDAPTTTRAHLRGRYIKAMRAAGQRSGITDWVHFRLTGDYPGTAVGDPFATSDPAVDRRIAELSIGAQPEAPSAPKPRRTLDDAGMMGL